MSSYIRHDAPIECFCPCFCCVFYGFRRCCTAPPLGINLARLGLEFCWGSAVSQACLTDAFIGHVHLLRGYMICPAIRHAPICPCFCCVFTGFDDAVRHRLWGSIWHALGSNSAGVPLFCKHASRMRSSAMSAYTRRYVQLSAMRLSIHAFSCFFYGFPSCCSAPRLGINLARLGLEFCWGSAVSQACLTDAFIGYVRLYAPICPSISAMMRL